MIEIGWFAFVVVILLAFCGGVVATFSFSIYLSKRLNRKVAEAECARWQAGHRDNGAGLNPLGSHGTNPFTAQDNPVSEDD